MHPVVFVNQGETIYNKVRMKNTIACYAFYIGPSFNNNLHEEFSGVWAVEAFIPPIFFYGQN